MSDNSWYEKGELPPVGTKCEVTHNGISGISGIWEKIEILKHDLNYKGSRSSGRFACISLSGINVGRSRKEGDLFWLHNVKDEDFKFRPIKTERELAIEAAVKVIYSNDHKVGITKTGAEYIAGKIYDAGLLRSKNES